MTGLRLMNGIMDPFAREAVLAEHRPCPEAAASLPERPQAAGAGEPTGARRSEKVRTNIAIPPAPYLDRRVRDVPHLAEVWSYINPQMLFGRHLGYKGNFAKDLAAYQPKALELFHRVEELKEEAARLMKVRAVWQFFPAEREGSAIHLFAARRGDAIPSAAELPLYTFRFARQPRDNGLCLSDYILEAEDGRRDHLVLFVVTAGAGIREQAEEWKRGGEFFKAHAVQALALETAEACAEWLHRRIREDWGFPDPPGLTMQDRFTSRYRGKRYSFGYPACPNLEDQQGIWKLLEPEDIGVALTDGMMMDPEASVSALVFHHPDCIYFNAGE
jgi:5-methyltetrahydrofolate--homocysteine methyltransferase